MLISELIKELQDALKKDGDMDVCVDNSFGIVPVEKKDIVIIPDSRYVAKKYLLIEE